MDNFVFWVLIVLAVDICAKAIILAKGSDQPRTMTMVAFDLLITIGLVVWGSVVYFA